MTTTMAPANITGINCPDRSVTGILALLILPVLAAAINILMIVAAYFHRSKLKRKNIYIYLYSTLLANVVFSLFAIYQLLNHHFQIEGNPSSSTNIVIKGWWSFRKAYTAGLFLTMIGNIGILISAIHDGSLLVARTSNSTPLGKHNKGNKLVNALKHQRRKAFICVFAVWFFPLLLALLTLTGWSCYTKCQCLSKCYTIEELARPTNHCNRIWTPMTNSYMGMIVLFWIIEFILLFGLILRTFRSSLYFDSPHEESTADQQNNTSTSQNQSATWNQIIGITSGTDHVTSVDASTNAKHSQKPKQTKQKKRRQKRAQIMWLRNAAKQLFVLTVVFLFCTVPVVIGIIIDVFRVEPLESIVASILTALPILYCIISPFLLMKHLGGLRAAFNYLLIRISSTRLGKKSHSVRQHSNSVTVNNSTRPKEDASTQQHH